MNNCYNNWMQCVKRPTYIANMYTVTLPAKYIYGLGYFSLVVECNYRPEVKRVNIVIILQKRVGYQRKQMSLKSNNKLATFLKASRVELTINISYMNDSTSLGNSPPLAVH